jgi:hypothetical protein
MKRIAGVVAFLAVTVILVLALATGAMAADNPMAGTWKLNVAKSKLLPNRVPEKEQTNVIQTIGDQFEITATGTRTDGSPISEKYTIPQQGGIAKQQGNPNGMSLVATRIDPYHVYWTFLLNDKQVLVMESVLSPDGKTLSNTFKATDAQGKPIEFLYFFERQ